MIKIITISGFCLFSLLVFVLFVLLKINGKGSFGRPSLPVYIFIIGKLSLFACFGMYIYALLNDNIVHPSYVKELAYISFAVYLAGMIITISGLINLGHSLRMGLPDEETQLKTKGIYRLTRNPIYVGFDLICLASVIFYSHYINIALFIIVCVYHHFVIRAEERFLEKKFDTAWKDYTKKTRRYL
jgi:protein-S-isoprenylcysteine O-methyltransferase Ste14